MLESLRIDSAKTYTCPQQEYLVQECLQNWLNNKPMRFHNLAPRYHYSLAQQAVLGWDQILYGRFTWAWCTLQEDHLHNNETPNATMKSERWLVGLITIIWSHVHENWETCNDNHHGINLVMREAAKYEMSKRETMELYEHGHRVVP